MSVISKTRLCIVIAMAAYGFAAEDEVERRIRAAEESLERLELAEAEQHLIAALAASESGASRATVLNNLGSVYHRRGKYDQAEGCYRRAIDLWRQVPGAGELNRIRSITNLAMHYVETHQFVKAERLGLDALVERLSGQEPARQDLARVLFCLSAVDRSNRAYGQAESHLLQALAIWDTVEPQGFETVEVLNSLALVYEEAGKPDDALRCYERARQAAETALHPADFRNAVLLANIAALKYRARGDAEAEVLFERALILAENSLGQEHPVVGRMLYNYAAVLRQRKKCAEAAKLEKRAVAILREAFAHQSYTIDISDLAPHSAKRE